MNKNEWRDFFYRVADKLKDEAHSIPLIITANETVSKKINLQSTSSMIETQFFIIQHRMKDLTKENGELASSLRKELTKLIAFDGNPSLTRAWGNVNLVRQILEAPNGPWGREKEVSAALLDSRLQLEAVANQLTMLANSLPMDGE